MFPPDDRSPTAVRRAFVKSLSVVDLTQCAPPQMAQPFHVIAELPAQGGSYDADTAPRPPRFGALSLRAPGCRPGSCFHYRPFRSGRYSVLGGEVRSRSTSQGSSKSATPTLRATAILSRDSRVGFAFATSSALMSACRTFASSARSCCDQALCCRKRRRLRASKRLVCAGVRRFIRQDDAFARRSRHTL